MFTSEKVKSNTENLSQAMREQIVSMLKGVIDDEEDIESSGSAVELSFGKRSEDELDIEDEETETESVSIKPRKSVDKSNTQKYYHHLYTLNTTNDNISTNLRQNKKSGTQNGSQHCSTSFNQNSCGPSCFNANLSGVSQKPKGSSFSNETKPMMPLRTFSFKNSYLKSNGQTQPTTILINEMPNPVIPLIKDKIRYKKSSSYGSMASELENMLVIEKRFTHEIFNHVKGHFVELIKNQQISRLCQFFFGNTSEDLIHLIFLEISSDLVQLLVDPYANYFCLKIFYFLNEVDRKVFLLNISAELPSLSVNKISTYPIQCIIESLTTLEEQSIVVNALKNDVMRLSLDLYGTHVIERILGGFEYEIVHPISTFICQNFLFLANNPNGLCVVKKEIIVENGKNNFYNLKREIINNTLVLIQNPYGNYALQTAFGAWDLRDSEDIMQRFYGKCIMLSLQKYSSNVIEKCLEISSNFRLQIMNEIFMQQNSCALNLLLKNNFGNYVVQTILKYVTDKNQLNMLINSILENLEKINDKKIIFKWKKIIASCM